MNIKSFFPVKIIIAALLICLSMTVVTVNAQGFDCKKVLDAKCDDCHYKTRICQALGKKSKRKWKRTIKSMIDKGTKLTREEQVKLAECLSKEEPGSKIVCE